MNKYWSSAKIRFANIWNLCLLYSRKYTLREKRLNTTPYIPVYGLRMPIYGSNLSEYGKIRDRIQAFFTQSLDPPLEYKIPKSNPIDQNALHLPKPR